MACRAADFEQHHRACKALRGRRSTPFLDWAEPPRAWMVGEAAFRPLGPAGPALCCYEEDWRHGIHEDHGSTNAQRDAHQRSMARRDPHFRTYYTHDGRRMAVADTTAASVGSLMKSEAIDTYMKLSWVMVYLFPSSLPPDDKAIGTPLVDWEECLRCEHGHEFRCRSTRHPQCGCLLTPGPPTMRAMVDLADVIRAVVHAGTGLDWSVPPNPGEQNLADGQPPHTSFVGEVIGELEYHWQELVRRANGGVPRIKGRQQAVWWLARDGCDEGNCGISVARQMNETWRRALQKSGARGYGENSCAFASSGVTLNYERMLAIDGDGAIWFDDKGRIHVDGCPEPGQETPSPGPWDGLASLEGLSRQPVPLQPSPPQPSPPQPSPPQPSPPQPQHPPFAVGQRVEISGLAKRADLNGQIGTVILAETGGGSRVAVEVRGDRVQIKHANLVPYDSQCRQEPP